MGENCLMLSINFRNANFVANNHADLLQNDIDTIVRNLKMVFNTAEHRMKTQPFKETCYGFMRINNRDKLLIVFSPLGSYNPYLFYYNSKTKEIKEEISLDYLKFFKYDAFCFQLEDIIKDIGSSQFKKLQTQELTRKINKLIEEQTK